jgi:hypothetical protein
VAESHVVGATVLVFKPRSAEASSAGAVLGVSQNSAFSFRLMVNLPRDELGGFESVSELWFSIQARL